MGSISARTAAFLLAGTAAAALLAPRIAGWISADRMLVVAALLAAALLAARLGVQRVAGRDRAVMPPSFIPVFAGLMLLDGDVATLMAAAVALSAALAARAPTYRTAAVATEIGMAVLATQLAGLGYRLFGGTFGSFALPWIAPPLLAATLAYYFSQRVLGDVLVPLAMRRPVAPGWIRDLPRGLPVYVIGAGLAGSLAALVAAELWQVLALAVAALVLAYLPYADYVRQIQEERARIGLAEFLDHGIAMIDRTGRISLWSDTLERMLGCPRRRAVGEPLAAAVPALTESDLERAIEAVLKDGAPCTIPPIEVDAIDGTRRVLDVKLVPAPDGAALLWHDVTERSRSDHESRRASERLELAAEGANDGLWQWNVRTDEFYVSGRWRAMIGLPPDAEMSRPDAWFDRVHPDDLADLQATLKAHLAGYTDVFQHEHRLRHEDGTYRRFLCRGLAVRDGRRRDRIAGSLTDTTEQAIAQERLRSVGFLDPLTGLYNRAVFVEGLGRRLQDARLRRVNTCFAVLYLDLDRFKIVNDSLGHLVGDDLLIAASRRLESCLRPGDALSRLGGDEFAILLSGLWDDAQANAIAMRIQDALSAPFSIGGREVFTSASIGIAFGPAHYTNPDEIMRDADTAMYHAKSRGKARHEVFDEAMHARVRDRLSLESDLRRAVAANDFEVHYQPIVSLTSGMTVGFESLVRWNRNGEAVSPSTFVPLAEELGLIAPLGTWVLQQASRTFADWQRRYPRAGLDCITVNVSSRQLTQQGFVKVVQEAVRDAGLRPADLRVEITETALMDSPGEAAHVLRELRDFGVKVYLDDFGTGYSSLSHLHKLPVDALKIDRSFVNSLLLPDRPAIVESILALARTLNTSVVAEGIENDVQARELERLGCTHAQGFLFSRPLATSVAEELVMTRRPLGPKAAAQRKERPVVVARA